MIAEQRARDARFSVVEWMGGLSPGWARTVLLLGCLLLYVVWLVPVPLTEVDEARFTEATRSMLATGQYLIPAFNGVPRYQKPVLYYWLQAGVVRLLGVNEAAARLPSAVAAILLVLLVHACLLHWLTDAVPRVQRGTAFLGAAALATTPLLAIWARAAVTDATLTLFISAACLALLQADLDSKHAPRWYVLAAAAAGLAFLTKGPIGVVIPVAVWLVYHLRGGSWRDAARRVPWASALAVFLLIAAPWYIATYLVDGPGFLRHFFLTENVARFATMNMEGHGFHNRIIGLFTYLPAAVLLLFPFSPFLLGDLVDRPSSCLFLPGRIRRFCWVWITVVIGLFSLSSTQLPSYIQSSSAPAALIFALTVLGWHERAPWRGRPLVMGTLAFVGCAWVAGIVYLLVRGSLSGPLGSLPFPQPAGHGVLGLYAGLGLALLVGVLGYGLRAHRDRLVAWVLVCWPLLLAVILLGGLPLAVRSAYGRTAEIGRYLRTLPPHEMVLTSYPNTSEGLVYYAHRRINFHHPLDPALARELRALLRAQPSVVVLTDAAGSERMQSYGNCQVLRRDGALLIVRVRAVPAMRGSRHNTPVGDEMSER